MSINPFALPVDWKAVATFFAGIFAVCAALYVANKQNQLKINEIRIALFEKRHALIKKFDELTREIWRDAKLSGESLNSFRDLVFDIELVFNDKVFKAAEEIFSDTVWHKVFQGQIKSYSEAQMHEKRMESVISMHDKLSKILESLPKLRVLLVSETGIGKLV